MLAVYLAMLDDDEDRERFEELYLKYRQDMYSVAYKVLHNVHDAEDAVHQAFLRIANNFEKIEEVDCPKTKAYTVIIVRNVAINIYNHNKKSSAYNVSIDTDAGSTIVDDSTFNEVDYQYLVSKITSLPDIYKDVLYLKHVQGYSNDEISQLLDVSKDAVYKRLQRAKSLLLDLLNN
jgi:RNA polymerase sigma-70 factor (ECF subfamily)